MSEKELKTTVIKLVEPNLTLNKDNVQSDNNKTNLMSTTQNQELVNMYNSKIFNVK